MRTSILTSSCLYVILSDVAMLCNQVDLQFDSVQSQDRRLDLYFCKFGLSALNMDRILLSMVLFNCAICVFLVLFVKKNDSIESSAKISSTPLRYAKTNLLTVLITFKCLFCAYQCDQVLQNFKLKNTTYISIFLSNL